MLDFTIKPKVTKELILSKINQETIFAHYLHINLNSKKLFRNPLRDDKNPTCGLYKSASGVLYMHDFATNDHYNCFTFVQKLFNCSNYYEALYIIAKDFGIYDNSKIYNTIKVVPELKEKKNSKIQVEIKDFSEKELKWWSKFGISEKLLNKYNVFSCKNVFLNGSLFCSSNEKCPIYGYYFGKNGQEELWKIYFPKRKSYRFIGNLDSKRLQGYKQLKKEGKILIITKSMKDCMTLRSLNLNAIAPNSETLFVESKKLEELKSRFQKIVVWYDNDRPGLTNLIKIRKEHPELLYFFIPFKYKVKDISDFYKKYGREETINFIKNVILEYKNLLEYELVEKRTKHGL